MKQDHFDQLARDLGATFYTNRHYPDGSAVTFSPSQWKKFKAEISNATIDKSAAIRIATALGWQPPPETSTVGMSDDPCPACRKGVVCRTPLCGRLRQQPPESNLKGGKTGWPPGLLQDDSKKLSQWFASRLDARYVLRSVVFKPFDDHEAITFHKLENKS